MYLSQRRKYNKKNKKNRTILNKKEKIKNKSNDYNKQTKSYRNKLTIKL